LSEYVCENDGVVDILILARGSDASGSTHIPRKEELGEDALRGRSTLKT